MPLVTILGLAIGRPVQGTVLTKRCSTFLVLEQMLTSALILGREYLCSGWRYDDGGFCSSGATCCRIVVSLSLIQTEDQANERSNDQEYRGSCRLWATLRPLQNPVILFIRPTVLYAALLVAAAYVLRCHFAALSSPLRSRKADFTSCMKAPLVVHWLGTGQLRPRHSWSRVISRCNRYALIIGTSRS